MWRERNTTLRIEGKEGGFDISVTVNNCWCHTVTGSVSGVSWLLVTILCTCVTEDVTLVHSHTKCDISAQN